MIVFLKLAKGAFKIVIFGGFSNDGLLVSLIEFQTKERSLKLIYSTKTKLKKKRKV